jgi:hypothetical protein
LLRKMKQRPNTLRYFRKTKVESKIRKCVISKKGLFNKYSD